MNVDYKYTKEHKVNIIPESENKRPSQAKTIMYV
ncbi:hypothetical protein EV201_2880 [Ancylomarina subtilis]|uniref:Uncharacterized protein n=1 Tax=Ancylomarina subtilis TaxID=1639035 RepID=A0A4Q7V959_9BACT|nr:hypothetical protein EV201_2880 [Ancylomarina subtilis]